MVKRPVPKGNSLSPRKKMKKEGQGSEGLPGKVEVKFRVRSMSSAAHSDFYAQKPRRSKDITRMRAKPRQANYFPEECSQQKNMTEQTKS